MGPRPLLDLGIRLAICAGAGSELVHELYALHARQWELEDRTRHARATAGQVAAAKHDIDASNSHRHQLIDQIDEQVPRSAAAQRLYSETVGELVDRLVILDLKHRALRRRQDATALTAIEHLHGHLADLVDTLLLDLEAGQARLPPRFGVKIYPQRRDPGAAA
ncbi:MAG: hypothetical protein AUG49_01495 [Catenulispora sp. 13_1_20CM_3_70_7]|nr:MAG: hypothetical protein AUG49_01495 [Catenulispora sp. 13_1_20CM_3_70_7]